MKTNSSAPKTLYIGLDVHKEETVIDVFDADGNNRRYWNYSSLKSNGLKTFDLKMSDFTDGSNDLSRTTRWRIGIEGTGISTSPFSGRIQLADLAWGRLPSDSIVKTFIGDQDNDGLADAAEDKNLNGIVDTGETDAGTADTDGDTYTDGVENRLGTNALDPSSQFSCTPARNPDGTLSLTWPSSPGTTFTISRSSNMVNWSTTIASGLPASAGTTTSYNLGSPNGTDAFYKIRLE